MAQIKCVSANLGMTAQLWKVLWPTSSLQRFKSTAELSWRKPQVKKDRCEAVADLYPDTTQNWKTIITKGQVPGVCRRGSMQMKSFLIQGVSRITNFDCPSWRWLVSSEECFSITRFVHVKWQIVYWLMPLVIYTFIELVYVNICAYINI